MRAKLLLGSLGCAVLLLVSALVASRSVPDSPRAIDESTPAAEAPTIAARSPAGTELRPPAPAASTGEVAPRSIPERRSTLVPLYTAGAVSGAECDADCIVPNDGDGIPVIEGRALDVRGRPLGRRRLVATLTAEADGALHHLQEEVFETERDGRFIVGFERVPDLDLVHHLELTERDSEWERPINGAVLALDRSLLSGLTDLGDLRLEGPRPLASGRTTDRDGNPVADARVALLRRLGGELQVRMGPWLLVPSPPAVSNGQAEFEVLGWGDSPTLWLAGHKPGHEPGGPTLTHAGATTARVVLDPLASVSGSLLVPEGLQLAVFEVRLSRSDRHDSEAGSPAALFGTVHPTDRRARLERPRSFDFGWKHGGLEVRKQMHVIHGQARPRPPRPDFTWNDLPPGGYSFEVTYAGSDRTVFATDLLLRPGQHANEGLLDAIDVRHAVNVFPVTVLDTDGLPIHGGQLTVLADELEPELAELPPGFALQGGRARVVTTRPVVDVEVDVPGHRTLVVRHLDGPRTVHLEDGIDVRLRLADATVLPRAPYALRAELEPEAQAVRRARPRLTHAEVFDAAGEEHLRVPAPGRYRVRWRLLEHREDSCRSIPLDGAPEPVLEIPDGGPIVFDVDLPAESTLPYR